jgi:predicted TIM-barrel fold metal-dependent hydrolase
VHREVTLIRRAIGSFHLDYMVVIPTPMLNLGIHPQFDMEAMLGRAYDKWFCENILPMDPKMKTMLFIPFNDPHAALKTVEELGDHPDVVGFMVTSVRHKLVHHNDYMKVYRAMEETVKPLAFHAGYNGPTRRWRRSIASAPCMRCRLCGAMSYI